MSNLSADAQSLIAKIVEAPTEIFSELAELAGLDPGRDFQGANLRGVDFSGSELRGFDFSFADLRGANWGDLRISKPSKYKFALRGYSIDPIVGLDHQEIFRNTLKAKTWGERFFSFAVATDNFGTVDEVLELLMEIVENDRSKYMKYSSLTYFLASSLGDENAKNYCRTMARGSNAEVNMFRFRKLNRLLKDLQRYGSAIKKRERFPGEVDLRKAIRLIDT